MKNQVMLKCAYVNDNGGMFTKDKVYTAELCEYSQDRYFVIDDKGTSARVPLSGSLWGFEVVEDKQENTQMDEPKFGDVLHISGKPVVFIRVDSDGDYEVVNRVGNVDYVDLEQIDEYAPDPTQELRERILERWKGQSLYHAYDTAACRADVSVGDIIGFVIENLNAEFDGE